MAEISRLTIADRIYQLELEIEMLTSHLEDIDLLKKEYSGRTYYDLITLRDDVALQIEKRKTRIRNLFDSSDNYKHNLIIYTNGKH